MIATNKHSRLWQSCENDYQVLTFQKDWYKLTTQGTGIYGSYMGTHMGSATGFHMGPICVCPCK